MTETPLDPEDSKIITLARSARARTQAAEGAAVRDSMGRTYAGCTVALPSLRLTALQAAVAAAVASGAPGFEAVAVVGVEPALAEADRDLVADLGAPTVLLATPDGSLRR